MESLIAPAFNLFVLIGIIVYYLREPIKKTIADRHVGLREEVERVSSQLKKAQEQLEEFTSKLKAIDTEIGVLSEQAIQDGKNMRLRLINEARGAHALVIKEAKSASLSLMDELRGEIQRSFSNRVIEKAEELIKTRLTGDDRVRIRREFSKQVVSVQ